MNNGIENEERAGPRMHHAVNSPETLDVLGAVLWLMSQSQSHKHLYVSDVEWLVLPALALKQFKVFADAGEPWALATWAFVSPEIEAAIAGGLRRLRPADWRSGSIPILIDVIAPFGKAERVLDHLIREVLGGQLKAVSIGEDGLPRLIDLSTLAMNSVTNEEPMA